MRKILKFLDYPHHSEERSVDFGNIKDYLFLPEIFSVRRHLYAESVTFVIFLILILAGVTKVINVWTGVPIMIMISGSIAFFYLLLMLFKLLVVYKAAHTPIIDFEPEEVELIKDSDLPLYTVLVPLYNEAAVIPQIKEALTGLDYPPSKLDIIITLEEYDHETRAAIEKARLPKHFRMLTLPDVKPKTKPKALNVAFHHIKGEYVVIFDAEIMPDADQLKKACLAFRQYPQYMALQTRLDHYNAGSNLITKLFNAEFAFYYDLFLPGLESLGFPIPLSGHSVHFRSHAVRLAGGWDPYNVAEDCDLGIRFYRMGYKVGILDSVSREEATETVAAWAMQRSRWMKGFIQTSIVHLRHPGRFIREIGGIRQFIAFLFVVPGSVFINIANIVYWVLLVAWFTTHSPLIQAFFPGAILTISFLSFVIGNFIFTYLNLIGSYKRGRMALVKWSLLSPFYWLLLSVATIRAAIQLIVKPHHWEKTVHGVHLNHRAPVNPAPIRIKRLKFA